MFAYRLYVIINKEGAGIMKRLLKRNGNMKYNNQNNYV